MRPFTLFNIAVLGCFFFVNPLLGLAQKDNEQTPVFELKFGNQKALPKVAQKVGKPELRSFAKSSNGLFLDGSSYLKFPGANTNLQFRNGQSITFEAWVAPFSVVNGQQIYVLGKGRTNRKGFAAENQNYAFRLRGVNGLAKISFLFRSINEKTGKQQYNRWNSKAGFAANGQWHHLVMHYEFGNPQNIAAWIDGKKTTGNWDMGGETKDPPVVDNDQLWLGSTLGGSPTTTYSGWIRDIRIFRNLKDLQQLVARANAKPAALKLNTVDESNLDHGRVLVEVIEQVPERSPPFLITTTSTEKFQTDQMALDGIPNKYVRPGIIADRTATYLVRALLKKKIPAGEYEILIRAKSASALMIGKRVVATLPMMKRNASGHEAVPKLLSYKDASLYPPPAGHQEKIIQHKLDAGSHVFRFETLVGGKGLRNELGEAVVGIRKPGDKAFEILGGTEKPLRLTYEDWDKTSASYRKQIEGIEQGHRKILAKLDAPYWKGRHQKAKFLAQKRTPDLGKLTIDRIIDKQILDDGIAKAELESDEVFIRRVFLDTIGIPPTRNQVANFVRSTIPEKRSRLIDRLLDHPGYADHWVSYWQDVLAENPGILKPKLNNTGPFRFWIYESLLDNKPMDRFASELIGMKGSRTGGGPAGFGQATQNDVPTAAKANVLSRAFLGIDLTCARCHDSPSSHFEQRDLFEMAAMLNRKPITLPKTSTVPNSGDFAAVRVTLKPGSRIAPNWPFEEDLKFEPDSKTDDSRRRLAEMITSPDNARFAEVIANRIWTRLMDIGLVDSPDDFLIGKPDHPALLQYLSDYLRANQFDAKILAKLILNSNAYQRKSSEDKQLVKSFAARKIKHLSAEQLVDSLFAVSGKTMSLGQISFDPEGRRTADTFLNLGEPRRAWELTSLANERDRPALAMPRAQAIVDILNAFGWRESRPNPISERENATTLVQPLVLSNGNATHRVIQLSDDSEFTKIAVQSTSVAQVVRATYLQILNREPTAFELQTCNKLLSSGFQERIVPGSGPTQIYSHQFRTAVSWSNHLHPDATKIKLRIEEAVRRGDFVSKKLVPNWRERMEDLVWALINSPEFTMIK